MLTLSNQPVGTQDPARQNVIDFLTTELNKLFPTNGVRVHARTILGEENVYIRYTHNRDASTCNSKIIENDPAYMGFCIGKERGTFIIEYPNIHFNRVMGRGKPVNFRKLRGATEMDVAIKLIKWFTTHKAIIDTAHTLDF